MLVCREDLAKPAQTLYLHNLAGILETAVRATNAQYDDADILKRLDVRLLEVWFIHITKNMFSVIRINYACTFFVSNRSAVDYWCRTVG